MRGIRSTKARRGLPLGATFLVPFLARLLAHLLPALGCLFVSQVSHAQSTVTIYGVADAGVVYQGKPVGGGASKTSVTGGGYSGSRLGFRGIEDLGGGTQATFNIESGFNMDDGSYTLGAFWGRLSYVGLRNVDYGELTLGRQLTPFYKATALQADPFGVGLMGCICALVNTAPRNNNSIAYTSPTFAGVQLAGFYALGEVEGDSSAGRTFSYSGSYTAGPLYVSLGGYNTNATPNTSNNKGTMLTGVYDLGYVKTYAAYQQIRSSLNGVPGITKTSTNVDVYWLAARIPIQSHTLIFGLGRVEDKRTTGNTGATATHFGAGYLYAFTKRTSLYASVGKMRNTSGAAYGLLDATTPTYGTVGADLGIRHLF